jgi:hypothetical protein
MMPTVYPQSWPDVAVTSQLSVTRLRLGPSFALISECLRMTSAPTQCERLGASGRFRETAAHLVVHRNYHSRSRHSTA